MQIPSSISNNFRFLLLEVSSQLKHLQTYFDEESASAASRIVDRSGYAHNLMLYIHNACTRQIALNDENDSMSMRAIASIATDLKRIAELCRECIHQLGYLRKSHKLDLSSYNSLLSKVSSSIPYIEKALLDNDTELALKLGRTEKKLYKSYQSLLKKYTEKLKQKNYTEDLVTGLFVASNIEQMGDTLLNISESIIASNIGQPMDFHRFESLRNSITTWADAEALSSVEVQPISETHSGSGVSSISYLDDNKVTQQAIFKNGKKRKLKKEFDSVTSWHNVFPGVAPKVFSYNKSGDSAALLIEQLQGLTFEKIALHGVEDLRQKAMKTLINTLYSIWQQTTSANIVGANFVGQIRDRLDEVYATHPYLNRQDASVCGAPFASFDDLLAPAEDLEQKFQAPFSVFIHGDFNIDNIIYDIEQDKISFIDLHRSTYMDYVQDVSVFMVSNYRLQVRDVEVRERIRHQVQNIYDGASEFASLHGDTSFDVRLAFGLARSFSTSIRFILDKSMARLMFFRARYLLEQLTHASAKDLAAYRIPLKELFRD
ncbi:MAG: phosphate uptake regulator [Lentisphaeria bacterium]|jgi:phosphate uptake regulator